MTPPLPSLPPLVGPSLCSDAATAAARAEGALTRLATLSAREVDVLALLARGQTSKLIAHDLGIAAKTVEIHRARIMAKMGCGSLVELGRLWEAAVWSSAPCKNGMRLYGDGRKTRK